MATGDSSTTRALSVTDRLRARIFDGLIEPGSHLMEVPLAQALGVSRTPVRDALARLADEGLLTYQPNRGFLVRRFGVKDVADAFTLRASLEALACRLIGERRLAPAHFDLLRGLVSEQHATLYGAEWTHAQAQAWHELNLLFHNALLELADNAWLSSAVHRARQLPIVYGSRMQPHGLDSLRLAYQLEHSRQALDEHRGVVDALQGGETSRAECLISEHVLTNRDVLVRALQSGERADAPSVNVGELGQTGPVIPGAV